MKFIQTYFQAEVTFISVDMLTSFNVSEDEQGFYVIASEITEDCCSSHWRVSPFFETDRQAIIFLRELIDRINN